MRKRRKRELTIAGFVIAILGFVFGRVLTDELKESVDSIVAAERLYRSEQSSSLTSMQLTLLQQQTNASIQKLLSAKSKDNDFSFVVAQDVIVLQQYRGDVNIDADSANRLLAALPSGTDDLKTSQYLVKNGLDAINKSIDGLITPTSVSDLSRTIAVKVGIIRLGLVGIAVVVYSDGVLTYEQSVLRERQIVYVFCKWIGYGLYAVGAALALYAQLNGNGRTEVSG